MTEKKESLIEKIMIIVIFLILTICLINIPDFSSYRNKELLIINEIMASNKSTIIDSYGKYSDYIELYNGNDYEINLNGYYLSDDSMQTKKYKIDKDVIIKEKSYLVIYASGKDTIIDNEIHTNFKLNKKGDSVILSNTEGDVISKIYSNLKLEDTSYGYDGNKYVYYYEGTPGKENNSKSSDKVIVEKLDNKEKVNIEKNIIINEVSLHKIELYNFSNEKINLDKYFIVDRGNNKINLDGKTIDKESYLVINYENVGTNGDILYLYNKEILLDTFNVPRLNENISSGIFNSKNVYYKETSFGSKNKDKYYEGYSLNPEFSINGGYVETNTKISLSTKDGGTIYYTTDGSFPNTNSKVYKEPINITKNTVIKAINIKNGSIDSDIVSRTYIVNRKHDVAYVSISLAESTKNAMFDNYSSNTSRKINFEFYEADGSLGFDFVGETRFSGMDSRQRPQKSMAIYLRSKYGKSSITYPLMKYNEYQTYYSFTLRNSGEDPKGIRIMDTALTYALQGEMDIDVQDYRPVVVYINGEYYGLFNIRERLNSDYIKTHYGTKEGATLIKYQQAKLGSYSNFNSIYNYIKNHDCSNKENYEYIKTQIDVQELINYEIIEAFYGNTDLGNIRYYKAKDSKWRWMLYDIDWSLWNTSIDMGYIVQNKRIPAATSLSSVVIITRKLYQNKEFKDLFLTSLSKYLNSTLKPERINGIVDELAKEIESEIPYHAKRWPTMKPSSLNNFNNKISSFKSKYKSRYNYVVNNLKSMFNLSNSDYNKYFGRG